MRYHEAGMHLHIHTNGDEASELMLDAIEAAQEAHYRPDHRHTLQHCQMADASQFRRMRKLGVCANLFANHVHYWGDQHAAITMGPTAHVAWTPVRRRFARTWPLPSIPTRR